jgi:hypothetical protein
MPPIEAGSRAAMWIHTRWRLLDPTHMLGKMWYRLVAPLTPPPHTLAPYALYAGVHMHRAGTLHLVRWLEVANHLSPVKVTNYNLYCSTSIKLQCFQLSFLPCRCAMHNTEMFPMDHICDTATR